MATDVRVPTTGNAGEDAVVLEWNVTEGSDVTAGDVLVTLETAKATIDVEAPISGQVLRTFYVAGDEVGEHEVLAVLGEPGEQMPPGGSSAGPAADADDMGTTSPAYPTPAVTATRPGRSADSDGRGQTPARRRTASPRARRLADEFGIDLTSLAGSGPMGRVIIADVVAAQDRATAEPPPERRAAPAPATAAQLDAAPGDEFTVVPVRGARKITAQRMQASLSNSAQLTLTRYAKTKGLLRFAKRLRRVTDATSQPRIGLNDLIMFGTVQAVAGHPEANSWFDWEGIKQFAHVNLGFAVDAGHALVVPVIRSADTMTLSALSQAARTAIDKARAGTLAPDEMDGGSFTVSNLGSQGIHWFTPVLNPPQTCILGVGAIHRTHPRAPSLLPLSLTFDHRAIDGAGAATLLADIARCIETVDVIAAL
ncbi:MAG TPA: dihydrolipoamide acetyltransferase family protein [Propionibacteriaceae bacterium]|nr:dihydrolipoamide acetyltransferase family protein [Propionibacteriaceae bacterium]